MQMRILIADDAPFIREIIRNILSTENVHLVPDACDGDEVILRAKQYQPDLIFLDISMPKRNGLDVCKEVLQILPQTRVVIISSLHDESVVQKAIEMGCADFIKKPFEVADIISAIKQLESKLEVANG